MLDAAATGPIEPVREGAALVFELEVASELFAAAMREVAVARKESVAAPALTAGEPLVATADRAG